MATPTTSAAVPSTSRPRVGLKWRVASALAMGAVVLGAAFFLPAAGVVVLLVLIAVAAILEFYRLLDVAGIPSFRVVGALAAVALVAATGWSLVVRRAPGLPVFEAEIFVLFITVITVLLRQFPQKHNPQPLATVACTLLGILYVPLLFNFFTKLAFTWDPVSPGQIVSATGIALPIYLIVVVKATDIGAYFIGSRLGRHKLIPRISPGKTWEGFIGGILMGLLASVMYHAASGGRLGVVAWSRLDAVALGLLLPLIGTVGDLTESLLKRAAGAKDSGATVPGMGGLLDVLDSLLFAAPVLYFYVELVLMP
jgi:phosphatidate cytidylyltransferase